MKDVVAIPSEAKPACAAMCVLPGECVGVVVPGPFERSERYFERGCPLLWVLREEWIVGLLLPRCWCFSRPCNPCEGAECLV